MSKSAETKVTRKKLIEGLNEDLAREYQAIIAYVNYSQVLKGAAYMNIAAELEVHAGQELQHAITIANQIDYMGGMPVVVPKPVKTSEKAEDMLRFDLDNENETIRQYRRRIKQCDELGEFATAEQIRQILLQEQDHQIALATAHAVQTRLTHTPAPSPALDPEVHDLLLRARHLWVQRTRPTIEAAIGYFRQALTLDPAFAPAYAGLASCYAILPITSNARPSECFPLAQQFAEQALALQSATQAQPEAHIALGLVQFWYWRNWDLAVHHFQQAELLNPSDSNGAMFLAHVHSILQQHDQAIATIHRARQLDPLSPIVNTHIGHFLYNAGRFQQALSPLDRILELVPQYWIAHLMRGKALGLLEQPEAAIESFSKALTFSSGNTETLAFRAYTLATTGHCEAALADLAALEHQRNSAFASPVHLAFAHLGLGNHAAALQLIDQAFEERDLRLIFLAVESRWQPLRDSGHFGAILRRAGLPER